MIDELELLAGPECLGRSVLVSVGERVPPPWEGCERVKVNTASLDIDTGRKLRSAWCERRRIVVELDGELPNSMVSCAKPWWELSPGLVLKEDVWHHLLTANMVDARDASCVRFKPRDQALAFNAVKAVNVVKAHKAVKVAADQTSAGDGSGYAGRTHAGDVVNHQGEAVWCDGGPLDIFDLERLGGVPVVCAANVNSGNLTPLKAVEPVADLAADQHAAVAHLGGAACIVAPAGSGKTRVISERVRYLVRDLGVDASAICLVAYNVRARDEMQRRTADVEGLQVRTLNSLAFAICNGHGPFMRPSRYQTYYDTYQTPSNYRTTSNSSHSRNSSRNGFAHSQSSSRSRGVSPGVSRNVSRSVRLADERTVRQILNDMLPRKRGPAMVDPIAPWIEALSASRLGLRDLAEVERDFAPDVPDFVLHAPAYAEELKRRNLVDYDHQIIRAVEVLLTDPQAREAARRSCAVMLVDEFQDLTPASLLLVRLLAGPEGNVYGVGDDDQTIYGYSGASPEWLINYSHYFPGATRHTLQVNYRCPKEVVDVASNLLQHNERRVPKQIRSICDNLKLAGFKKHVKLAEHGKQHGKLAIPVVQVSIGGGAESVLTHIGNLVDAGAKLTDIAVLARVNNALLAPQVVLGSAGIGRSQPVGMSFMTRKGVAAVFAWLSLACTHGKLKSADLRSASRCPPRKISPKVVDWIAEQRSVAALKFLSARIKDERTASAVHDFAEDVHMLQAEARRSASTVELIETIRDIGVGASLEERLDASRRSVDRSAHGDDLRALLDVARLHSNPASFEHWMEEQLVPGTSYAVPDTSGEAGKRYPADAVGVVYATGEAGKRYPADATGNADAADNAGEVYLGTVHRVKGLEWPHVIVFDASDGLMPHRLAGDMEEERRIFHVAITRCSESLMLVSDNKDSTYLKELGSVHVREYKACVG